MEEEKIIIAFGVREKLFALIDILMEQEYFSFQDNAHDYVNEIIDFIYTIPHLRHKSTNSKKYGSFYCKFKANNRTTWFVTFDIDGNTFLIKNIINNHTRDYPTFIRGLK
jgi:hypothetical protein